MSRAVIIALWLAGFFLSLPLIQPGELARLGAIGCVFTAMCLALTTAPATMRLAPLRSGPLISATLFYTCFIVAISWSAAPYISIISVCTLGLLAVPFLVFSVLPNAEKIIKPCLYGGGAIIAGFGAWAIIQYFFFPEMLVSGQVRAPFASPNSYAALLSLGFFCGLGFMASSEKRARFLALALCALTLCGMVVIGGRGALLCLILALVVFMMLERASIRRLAPGLAFVAASTLLVFILAGFSADALRHGPAEQIAADIFAPHASAGNRIDIWMATLQIIREHFWTGTGPGTFFLFYSEHRPLSDRSSSGLMAHSDPLQFWAEAGIAAPLLFYAFLFFCALRMVRFLKTTPPAPERTLAAALFCGLGAMALHSHIDFNLYVAPILAFSGMLLAHWYRLSATENSADSAPNKATIALRLAACLPLLAALFFAQGFLRSEYYCNEAHRAGLRGDMQSYAIHVNKADRAGFGWTARPYVMAAAIPLGLLETKGPAAPHSETDPLFTQADNFLIKAQKRNARMATAFFYRGLLRTLAAPPADHAETQTAEDFIDRALTLDLLYLPARMLRADLYQKAEQDDKALTVLKDGLMRPYKSAATIAYYARTAKLAQAQGDQETHEIAIKKLRAAQKAAFAQATEDRLTLP